MDSYDDQTQKVLTLIENNSAGLTEKTLAKKAGLNIKRLREILNILRNCCEVFKFKGKWYPEGN